MSITKKTPLILLLIFLICPTIFATEPEQNTKQAWQISHQIEKQIQSTQKDLKAQLETYSDAKISKLVNENFKSAEKRLEKQGEILENHNRQQLESMRYLFAETKDFILKIIGWSSFIFSILIAIAVFLYWKQGLTLKDFMEKNLKGKLTEFEEMKMDYEKALKENRDLRKRLASLTTFTDKKIVWAFENSEIEAAKEIKAIEEKGFRVRQCLPGQEHTIAPDHCDFMIYSFCQSDRSIERLKNIICFLDTLGKEIPLIIYTYNNGNPKYLKEENEVIQNKNYVLSNMPLTLQIYFNSLIRD